MNRTVLIIDDDKQIRKMLLSHLENSGYMAFAAQSGKEGMHLAKEVKPDIVVTDILMSDMDGFAVIKEITVKHPTMKIIAMSGGGALPVNYLHIAELLGVEHTIKKPFDINDFQRAIEAA